MNIINFEILDDTPDIKLGRSNLSYSQKLEAKYGRRFELISEYVSARKDVKIKCNICGLIAVRNPVKLLYKGTCKGCNVIKMTKSHEQFVEEIKLLHGDEYSILSKYVKDKNKVFVKHNYCGASYFITPSRLLQSNGKGCRFCRSERMIKNAIATKPDLFRTEVLNLVGDEYSVLDDYVNANTSVTFKHNSCGHEYKTRPNLFRRGSRCPKCAIEKLKSKNPLNRRISKNIRCAIIHVLQGRQKSASSFELVGCSVDELKLHLETQFIDGMNWDNYGPSGWHIDHIRPCASFNLSDAEEQKKCFHFSNLQPLWSEDNVRKHSWWEGKHYGKMRGSP